MLSFYFIYNKEFFPKYTNFCTKEHKLYDKLLDKISLKIELLVLDPSEKNGLALVPISHTPFFSIQNNFLLCFSLFSLSYKSPSPSSPPVSKKSTVEVEDVNSDVEIQSLSFQ